MAHHTIVYGRINGASWKTEDFHRLHRVNIDVINNLSEKESTFPWINKSMFNVPNELQNELSKYYRQK